MESAPTKAALLISWASAHHKKDALADKGPRMLPQQPLPFPTAPVLQGQKLTDLSGLQIILLMFMGRKTECQEA